MGIADTKRAIGRGKPVRSSEAKPEKAPTPTAKEIKKDTSIFRGDSHVGSHKLEYRLKDPKLYESTKLSEQDRVRLGGELSKAYGDLNPAELKDASKQAAFGKWGKFKHLSQVDRAKLKRLAKGISGE